MNTKKIAHGENLFYIRSNDDQTFSNDVSNWKTVLCVHTKKKDFGRNDLQCHLRRYFANHMALFRQLCETKEFIDRRTFEEILRNSGLFMEKSGRDDLWNSCQPMEKGISSEVFRRYFAPLELENKQNSKPIDQPRLSTYAACIDPVVKSQWQKLKEDFTSLDPYGRLIITIDQAINLMKKYSFPLNEKQQCELALLFSPKNNGQFHYFDFMKCFIDPSSVKSRDQGIFSRSTYSIQSKQTWSEAPITIDDILHRIRSQSVLKYGNIHRMFQKIDQHRQRYLTKLQFNQLLQQFDIHLDEHEFYHLISEIDTNQNGILTYDELYRSLITDLLQI